MHSCLCGEYWGHREKLNHSHGAGAAQRATVGVISLWELGAKPLFPAHQKVWLRQALPIDGEAEGSCPFSPHNMPAHMHARMLA